MSSYQIIRNVWLNFGMLCIYYFKHKLYKTNYFLGKSDWLNDGITLVDKESKKDVKIPSMSDFHSSFQVVFVDSSGYLNICANVFKSNYIHVSHG